MSTRRFWFRYIGLFLLILLVAAVGIGGWMIYRAVSTAIRAEENFHTTTFAIRLVEQFVHDKGRWPASWDELRQLPFPNSPFTPLNSQMPAVAVPHGYEWPGQVEHLKEHVTIDFQIDPKAVANQDSGQFTAIMPIGPYYEYRGYGFVQSLQQTLKMAVEAQERQAKHSE
jgi:hypothetical protein